MKYINQINLALVVIAAAAVVYAFTRTYFAPSPAFVAPVSSPAQESGLDATPASSELETAPAPRLSGPSGAGQNPPPARSRGVEGFTAPQNPPSAPVRTPQSGAAGGARIITPRSTTPNAPRARPPVRAPIRRVDPGARTPQRLDEEELDPESDPQNPPDLRRGNRRGGANPPPAQSSAPDRRRP